MRGLIQIIIDEKIQVSKINYEFLNYTKHLKSLITANI